MCSKESAAQVVGKERFLPKVTRLPGPFFESTAEARRGSAVVQICNSSVTPPINGLGSPTQCRFLEDPSRELLFYL